MFYDLCCSRLVWVSMLEMGWVKSLPLQVPLYELCCF